MRFGFRKKKVKSTLNFILILGSLILIILAITSSDFYFWIWTIDVKLYIIFLKKIQLYNYLIINSITCLNKVQ